MSTGNIEISVLVYVCVKQKLYLYVYIKKKNSKRKFCRSYNSISIFLPAIIQLTNYPLGLQKKNFHITKCKTVYNLELWKQKIKKNRNFLNKFSLWIQPTICLFLHWKWKHSPICWTWCGYKQSQLFIFRESARKCIIIGKEKVQICNFLKSKKFREKIQ